jgi:hypothetical protein
VTGDIKIQSRVTGKVVLLATGLITTSGGSENLETADPTGADVLAGKLSDAEAALDANDLKGTCAILGAFVDEVNTQTGKKIVPATAAALIADATRIETVLGC